MNNASQENSTMKVGPGRWAWVTDALLALSSYTAMFAALALRFECPPWLRPTCIALALVGLAATAFFFVSLGLRNFDYVVIESIDDRGADVSGYLATYLLPIAVVGTPNANDIVAYALVIFVMTLVYIRSRAIQINPTFYVFGYRLFLIRTSDGFEGFLLSRIQPPVDQTLKIVRRANILLAV